MAIVIDASVALGWVLPSQASSLTRAALKRIEQHTGWVPPHFAIEVARALRGRERRGLLSSSSVDAALVLLRAQALRQDQVDALEQMSLIISLARTYGIRVADAAYLELAMRLQLSLATQDAALAEAAGRASVAIFRA